MSYRVQMTQNSQKKELTMWGPRDSEKETTTYMASLKNIMECLLCLSSNQDVATCILVNSMKWEQFRIKELIDKHLWSIEPISPTSHLCLVCWEELNDFNKFYRRIEETHNGTKFMVKTEATDLLEEDINPMDFLLESKIEIGQTLYQATVIEQEIEDDVTVQNDSNDLDKANPLDIPGDESACESEEIDNTDSDDDLPLKCSGPKNKCSNAKTKQISANHKEWKGNIDRSKYSKSKPMSEDKNDVQKSCHIPKKYSSFECDKFLREHFKITCNICDEPFERFRDLSQHYSKEHNEQGFVICCDTKFFLRVLLVDHINCHLNPEYFKCVHCDKVLATRRGLQVHLKLHDEKNFCCDMCDKKYIEKYKLENHKLKHLPQPEKKFPCNECGKFYVSEYVLTQHQRAVHLNFYARVCEICGQTLPDSTSYKNHMMKHNPTAKSFKCEYCGLIVTSQTTLKRHRDLKHPVGGNSDHRCHICQKVSPTMRALKKHIQEAHEMGYKFKCTVCEKEFKRSDNFKSHMAMHTGKPLHSCPWCPKEFNSNGNMHQHRKKAHPIEWEEAQRKKYSGNLPPNF